MKPTGLDFGFHSSLNLQNNVQKFKAGDSYGKVASDREGLNNSTFKTFTAFRDASIGMFVPGCLFGTGTLIATLASFFVTLNLQATGMTDWGLAIQAVNAFQPYVIGSYFCLAFGIFSSIFLACGVAFAICAGVFYYKWAEQREITAYNAISSDKPQFAQGFSISL